MLICITRPRRLNDSYVMIDILPSYWRRAGVYLLICVTTHAKIYHRRQNEPKCCAISKSMLMNRSYFNKYWNGSFIGAYFRVNRSRAAAVCRSPAAFRESPPEWVSPHTRSSPECATIDIAASKQRIAFFGGMREEISLLIIFDIACATMGSILRIQTFLSDDLHII